VHFRLEPRDVPGAGAALPQRGNGDAGHDGFIAGEMHLRQQRQRPDTVGIERQRTIDRILRRREAGITSARRHAVAPLDDAQLGGGKAEVCIDEGGVHRKRGAETRDGHFVGARPERRELEQAA